MLRGGGRRGPPPSSPVRAYFTEVKKEEKQDLPDQEDGTTSTRIHTCNMCKRPVKGHNNNLKNHLYIHHRQQYEECNAILRSALATAAASAHRPRDAQSTVAATLPAARSSRSRSISSSSSRSAAVSDDTVPDSDGLLQVLVSASLAASAHAASLSQSSSSSASQPAPDADHQRDIGLLHRIWPRVLPFQYVPGHPAATASTSAAASGSSSRQPLAEAARSRKRDASGSVKPDVRQHRPEHVPFTYIGEVLDSLYNSEDVPIQLWSTQLQENPLLMHRDGGPHRVTLEAVSKLFTVTSWVYDMAFHPINVPSPDNEESKWTYEALSTSRSQLARTLMGEMTFLNSMRAMLSSCTLDAPKQAYLRDIEDQRDLLWMQPPSATDILVQHYLNANLINTTDKRSLLLAVPNGYSCPGFNSPSYYLKLPDSFFRMHWEQLFAPFYNYCWMGSTIWYAVRESDRDALETCLVHLVARRCEMSELDVAANKRLLWALVYSRQLFLDPFELQAYGVPVHRIEQTAGQVVVGKGTVLHWGLCGGADSVNEAVNWLPVQWLEDGLPQLVKHMEWLRDYVKAEKARTRQPQNTVSNLVFDEHVQRMVGHHTPPKLTASLLNWILADLNLTRSERKCDYSALPEESEQHYKESLKSVLEVLERAPVKQWYARKFQLKYPPAKKSSR
jgi:hypothetical protein